LFSSAWSSLRIRIGPSRPNIGPTIFLFYSLTSLISIKFTLFYSFIFHSCAPWSLLFHHVLRWRLLTPRYSSICWLIEICTNLSTKVLRNMLQLCVDRFRAQDHNFTPHVYWQLDS
jgi:hypothetical protein